MALSRRMLIRTGAAGVVVVGGTGLWLANGTARSAREPWQLADEGFGDQRLNALAYAILAPNPHNMQPWQVHLEGDDAMVVYADPERLLPETDQPARQITIGFGAFLELFRQAAAQQGLRAEIDPFPEGEPGPSLDGRPVARARLVAAPEVVPDPLFPWALRRRTQRTPFDDARPVSDAQIERILEAATPGVAVAGSADPARVNPLRSLTREAWITEWENAATRRETIAVTRIGRAEVDAHPWGITLDGPLMNAMGTLGLVSRGAMDEAGTTSYEETLRFYNEACDSAMAHIWSTTATNTRRDQLNAGASWVRLHQAATREGLSFHPLSQALQEFPAMARHYRRVHELLASPGHTVQMLVRLGYAPGQAPAPREPLESKLIPG